MLLNPRLGQQVQVWYRAELRWMPYHGRIGTVVAAGRGKPRNHLLEIDGQRVVVPCGNVRRVEH
jgi:hypothetical protein